MKGEITVKTIIVYYSLEGFTKKWSEEISKKTGADLLAIHPVKEYPDSGAKKYLWGGKSALMGQKPKLQPYIFNADKYDRVILAYPVWASSVTPPIRSFAEENRDALSGKKIGAIATYMGSGAQKSLKKLSKLLNAELEPRLILTDLEEKKSENEQLAAGFIRQITNDQD